MLGEKVDTQVSVLTGGAGGGDADDLAGTALQHQEIAGADVVAGDGDGAWGDAGSDWGWSCLHVNVGLLVLSVMVVMVMMTAHHVVSSLVQTVTEGVVVP